jgi:hypothetical protein
LMGLPACAFIRRNDWSIENGHTQASLLA